MTAVFAFKKDLLTIKIPPTLPSGGIFVVFSLPSAQRQRKVCRIMTFVLTFYLSILHNSLVLI